MKEKFNIAFFGSSEFVIGILASIQQHQNLSLKQVFLSQLEWLERNQGRFLSISPQWLSKKTELIELIETNDEFEQKINLVVVVSQPDRENRGKIFSNPVVQFARKQGTEVFLPEKINKSKEEFTLNYGQNLDIAIVASFGQIVSTSVLEIPKYGFVNWHPSKLPAYRGPTPMQSALQNGDKIVALSWINMTKEMDAGDIWLQLESELGLNKTFNQLAIEMGELGQNTWCLTVVAKILNQLGLGNLKPVEQNPEEVVYCKMLEKEDKFVDPQTQTATEIYNHYRGLEAFPGTVLNDKFFGEEIKILDCVIDPEMQTLDNNEIQQFGNWIQTKSGKQIKTYLICAGKTLLQVKKIMRTGGKQVDFSGFLFG